MRTEIDLNECEHFLKANLDRSNLDWSILVWNKNGQSEIRNQSGLTTSALTNFSKQYLKTLKNVAQSFERTKCDYTMSIVCGNIPVSKESTEEEKTSKAL